MLAPSSILATFLTSSYLVKSGMLRTVLWHGTQCSLKTPLKCGSHSASGAPLRTHLMMSMRASGVPISFIDPFSICLLYTSDAADDLLCVDLGGRRIIKKKK